MWTKVFRAARLGVAAVLLPSLGGCLWLALTESTDNQSVRYDGTVLRAGGIPVAGARVVITEGHGYFVEPPPPNAAPCSGVVGGPTQFTTTDAQGRYRKEFRREEDEFPTSCLSVRFTPAIGSGLAETVVQGESRTFDLPGSDRDLIRRRVDVVLRPAP